MVLSDPPIKKIHALIRWTSAVSMHAAPPTKTPQTTEPPIQSLQYTERNQVTGREVGLRIESMR